MFYASVLMVLMFETAALTLQIGPLNSFTFTHSQTRRSEDCNVCYGGQCAPLEQSRCDYYVEADAMMTRDDEEPQGIQNPELKSDVDSILFDMVEKAELSFNLDCIPYISRYTDCTKENICLGCKNCYCDGEGRWNCSSSTSCRTVSPAIDVDHKVLVSILENLQENITSLREKRSVTNKLDDDHESDIITSEELYAWLVGVDPFNQSAEDMPVTETTISTENDTVSNENNASVDNNTILENTTTHNNTPVSGNTIAIQNDTIEMITTNATQNESIVSKNTATTSTTKNTATTQNDTMVTEKTAAIHSFSLNTAHTDKTSLRVKRSVTDNPLDDTISSTITMEELSAWLYGLEYDKQNYEKKAATENSVATPQYSTHIALESQTQQTSKPVEDFQAKETIIKNEPDYLAFDEVLNNIAIDTKNYTRRKSLSDLEQIDKVDIALYNNTNDFDYMLIDDEKPNNYNLNNATEMPFFVNFVTEVNEVTVFSENSTKNVIDLLANANNNDIFNETVFKDVNTNKDDIFIVGFDNNNDVLDYSSINVMKRDVSTIMETTKTPNVSNAVEIKIINITNTETIAPSTNHSNLKQDVLLPLVKIINSKQDDILELTKMKHNLINFMTHHNQSPVVEIIDYPNISASNTLHDLEMFPELGFDLRRVNTNFTEKMYLKMKSHIYEVIKDILKIRKYQKGNLPNDLNLLLNNLRRYLTKSRVNKRKFKTRMSHVFRRRWNTNFSKCSEATFKECIIEIVETIDLDMPKENALAPLSNAAKKIMRHIVRTFFRNQFTIDQRVHDPNYDITNDIKKIGSKWLDMANTIIGKSPSKTFYKMKQLHMCLETDVAKIQDMLKSLDFALNRRMIPYFKSVEDEVVEEINRGLKSIFNKVHMIQFEYDNKNSTAATIARMKYTNSAILNEVINSKKKRSFLRHIRNLLKSSKKDTNELLQKKVPKSEIVKQLAKKKLDELAQKRYVEYGDTMRKWQRTLNVLPRLKRSIRDRIKNIIPKYLRHKVNPKLTDQKKNTTHKLKDNTGRRNKKRGHKHRNNVLTTVTSSKTNKITKQKTTSKPKVSSTLSMTRQVKKQ